jgi:Lon protease-like protein
MSDDLGALEGFKGKARLFPLPNLVLFPHAIQPLHIFEPRYRQMTMDALDSDRLIALVLLRPGWESDYEGRPPIHAVACLGRIVTEQRLAGDKYNILLRGVSRLHILGETKDDRLYRSAKVELLTDQSLPEPQLAVHFRRQLAELAQGWLPAQEPVREQFQQLIDSELPIGTLTDITAFALPLDVDVKQQVLEQLHVEARVRFLLAYLEKHRPKTPHASPLLHKFPPDFSDN